MLELFIAASITAIFFAVMFHYMSGKTTRRLMGHPLLLILTWHVLPLVLFIGAPSLLLQAEAAGLMLTFSTMTYRKLFGFERFSFKQRRYIRYAGVFTGR